MSQLIWLTLMLSAAVQGGPPAASERSATWRFDGWAGPPIAVHLAVPEQPAPAHLRHTPEADAQGAHRLARGQHFFETGRRASARLGVPFGWQLSTVQGVSRDNARMAPAAAALIAASPPCEEPAAP